MDTRFDIYTKATDRNAAGFLRACAIASPGMTRAGESSTNVRHPNGLAAGETNALVARCVL